MFPLFIDSRPDEADWLYMQAVSLNSQHTAEDPISQLSYSDEEDTTASSRAGDTDAEQYKSNAVAAALESGGDLPSPSLRGHDTMAATVHATIMALGPGTNAASMTNTTAHANGDAS